MILTGKCYLNGLGDRRGPIRPYGLLFQDHQGFAFLRNGEYLVPGKPEKDLVEEEPAPRDYLYGLIIK